MHLREMNAALWFGVWCRHTVAAEPEPGCRSRSPTPSDQCSLQLSYFVEFQGEKLCRKCPQTDYNHITFSCNNI